MISSNIDYQKPLPMGTLVWKVFDMRTHIIHRSQGIFLVNEPLPISLQVYRACRDFFALVDTEKTRNVVEKISKNIRLSFQAPTKRLELKRKATERRFGRLAIARIILHNKWVWFKYRSHINRSTRPEKIGYRFPRERTLSRLVWIATGIAGVATIADAIPISNVRTVRINLEAIASQTPLIEKVVGPVNWLTGEASRKGSSEAVAGAFNYATKAGYEFTRTSADVNRLVADGTLMRIDSKYVTLKNVSYPYALPTTVKFLDRLGAQYAWVGCGKLVVTSGVRPLAYQTTLRNGSNKSVHPTGMSVDLERTVPRTPTQSFCLNWLNDTLLAIEASRRLDHTAENSPRHYHEVVVPEAYEVYLKNLPQQLDPEVEALAYALHFEAAGNETMEGYRAIGWTIRNRVRSSQFPNTVVEVVAEGAAGRSKGGCQFSFKCDGKPEKIQTLCAEPSQTITQYWRNRCQERFATMVTIAKQVLAEPKSADPTGGAVLYYAASMPQAPYWARYRVETRKGKDGKSYFVTLENGDLKTGTIKKLGSHIFGCRRNSDVCGS